MHARDIIDKFVRDSIMDAREFAWESQLRFYWDKALVSLGIECHTVISGRGCRPCCGQMACSAMLNSYAAPLCFSTG